MGNDAWLTWLILAVGILLVLQVIVFVAPGVAYAANPIHWPWPVIWTIEVLVIVGLFVLRRRMG